MYKNFAIFLFITIWGCEKDSSNSGEDTLKTSIIDGIWKSDCIASGDFSTQFVMTNSSAVSRLETFFYADKVCDTLGVLDTTEREFLIRTLVPNSSDIYEIDFTSQRSYREYLTTDAVNGANEIGDYGYFDWTINVPKDVTGKPESEINSAVSGQGEKLYTIFRIQDDSFFSGDLSTGNGLSEANRPISLRTDFVMTRQ